MGVVVPGGREPASCGKAGPAAGRTRKLQLRRPLRLPRASGSTAANETGPRGPPKQEAVRVGPPPPRPAAVPRPLPQQLFLESRPRVMPVLPVPDPAQPGGSGMRPEPGQIRSERGGAFDFRAEALPLSRLVFCSLRCTASALLSHLRLGLLFHFIPRRLVRLPFPLLC